MAVQDMVIECAYEIFNAKKQTFASTINILSILWSKIMNTLDRSIFILSF